MTIAAWASMPLPWYAFYKFVRVNCLGFVVTFGPFGLLPHALGRGFRPHKTCGRLKNRLQTTRRICVPLKQRTCSTGIRRIPHSAMSLNRPIDGLRDNFGILKPYVTFCEVRLRCAELREI
jgi:hypothetical protein